MLKVPNNISGADLAFGNIDHMPKYADVPDQFKTRYNPYVDAVSSWFFKGAEAVPGGIKIGDATFVPKSGIELAQALGAIKSVLASWAPKHEHKTAACAYMLSEWFDRDPAVFASEAAR